MHYLIYNRKILIDINYCFELYFVSTLKIYKLSSLNTNNNHNQPQCQGGRHGRQKASYQAPQVITYSEDEIIELLGPAQTCSPSPCPTYQ